MIYDVVSGRTRLHLPLVTVYSFSPVFLEVRHDECCVNWNHLLCLPLRSYGHTCERLAALSIVTSTTMSKLEVAHNLSVSELLHVLNEKLDWHCTWLREWRPPVVSTTSLETEASTTFFPPSQKLLGGISRDNGKLQIESLQTRAHDILKLIPSLRNLLKPVNRLPQEILSEIAQCSLYEGAAVDARSVIPLTHVSRYWRQSIASDPANWTLISNYSKGLTALSLEHAKAVPLKVYLFDRDGTTSWCLPIPLIQNVSAIRAEAGATIERLRQALPGFPGLMPNLRSLTFSSGFAVDWDGTVDPFESLTPTLRHLDLGGVPFYPSIHRLNSLTEFSGGNLGPDLHLDVLLDFIEGNTSLERVSLSISFRAAPLRISRRETPIKNQIRYLSIQYGDPLDAKALTSCVALQRGVHLVLTDVRLDGGLNDILSVFTTTHLSNLPLPTVLEYESYRREIWLAGPNGVFELRKLSPPGGGVPFGEFPLLPLTHIRKVSLVHRMPGAIFHASNPVIFDQSFFPAIEVLAIDCGTSVSFLLSSLFSKPSTLPSLRTLAFLNCNIDEGFMEELVRYASKRKDTTSAPLHQVVILNSDGVFPKIASIRRLGKLVPVLDVKIGTELLRDLV